MNELARFSLTDTERARALHAITSMLEGFPQKVSDAAGMARAFMDAVDDLPITLIEETAVAFARGRAGKRNNVFPPSTAEFHARADHVKEQRWLEAQEAERQGQVRALTDDRPTLRSADEITAERLRKQLENHQWREQFARENPVAAAKVFGGGAFSKWNPSKTATGKRLAS